MKEDRARAAELYKKAAALGDVSAQTILGVCYYNGDGVAQDYAEAAKWWRKAAEQGFAQAQVSLGACYKHGVGVSQDNDEAIRWLRKAAEQDEVKAQVLLAGCYFEESVKNFVRAKYNENYDEIVAREGEKTKEYLDSEYAA